MRLPGRRPRLSGPARCVAGGTHLTDSAAVLDVFGLEHVLVVAEEARRRQDRLGGESAGVEEAVEGRRRRRLVAQLRQQVHARGRRRRRGGAVALATHRRRRRRRRPRRLHLQLLLLEAVHQVELFKVVRQVHLWAAAVAMATAGPTITNQSNESIGDQATNTEQPIGIFHKNFTKK